MNQDILKGKWDEIKGKLQKNFGKLTNDDYQQIKGDWKILSGSLQKRYGYSKDKAEKAIKDFEKDNRYQS